MKICLTGSSGRLGAVIASQLCGNHSVVGVDSARGVLLRHFPDIEEIFARNRWKLPKSIDRVYSIEKTKEHLGYSPLDNFDTLMGIKENIEK